MALVGLEDLQLVVRVAVVLDVDDAQHDAVEVLGVGFEDVRRVGQTRVGVHHAAALQRQAHLVRQALARALFFAFSTTTTSNTVGLPQTRQVGHQK